MIHAAVEGNVDEAVVRRLVGLERASLGPVWGKSGKDNLLRRLPIYNQAATDARWLVVVDLDQDAACAPPFIQQWLPRPAPLMCLRVAVREIEAWLIADRERLSNFLRVPISRIPHDPEALAFPKLTMVEIAGHSRKPAIREDMTPRPGSGLNIGAAYNSWLIDFTLRSWRPRVAERNSDSLRRCRKRLRELIRE